MLQAVENKQKQYNTQLLSTKEMYDKYWGQCIPLLQECINNSMHEEMTVEDIYTRALKGELYIIIAKNDDTEVPDVKMVMVLELVYYPQFTAMNIVCIAGSDLRHMIKKYSSQIYAWAQVCGVTKMECLVSPAMEKILQAQGFEQKYLLIRKDLTKEN